MRRSKNVRLKRKERRENSVRLKRKERGKRKAALRKSVRLKRKRKHSVDVRSVYIYINIYMDI